VEGTATCSGPCSHIKFDGGASSGGRGGTGWGAGSVGPSVSDRPDQL